MSRGNVILIGMPASGKSTAGVILAKVLGCDFIDTDLLLQRCEGRRLEAIIRDEGVDGFLKIEERVCAALEADGAVIATGGSVVYGEAAMCRLKAIGTVVYLEVDFPTLEARLSDIKGRGVALREGQTLRMLYDERVPLYRRWADVTIPERGQSLEQTVAAVRAALAASGIATDPA